MRWLVILSAVFLSCASAHAVDAPAAKTAPSIAQPKASEAKDNALKCYPDALTENERSIGMATPCAPKNYTYMPLISRQEETPHDRSGIWSDLEVKDSTLEGQKGAWIFEHTAKIGETEVTVSLIAAALCAAPSMCPFRVRLKTPGKPDVIKGWPKTDQGCSSEKYYFIRNDFKEILACEEPVALDP